MGYYSSALGSSPSTPAIKEHIRGVNSSPLSPWPMHPPLHHGQPSLCMSGHDPHTGITFGLSPTEAGFLFLAPKRCCSGAARGSGSVYPCGAGDRDQDGAKGKKTAWLWVHMICWLSRNFSPFLLPVAVTYLAVNEP